MILALIRKTIPLRSQLNLLEVVIKRSPLLNGALKPGNYGYRAIEKNIKEKELRLSQLRSMDTHKLRKEDRELLQSLEKEIKQLKEQLQEE